MQKFCTIRTLQEDLDFLGLSQKKDPIVSALSEDIGNFNSLNKELQQLKEEIQRNYKVWSEFNGGTGRELVGSYVLKEEAENCVAYMKRRFSKQLRSIHIECTSDLTEERDGTYKNQTDGKILKTKVFKTDKEANDFMIKNPGYGVAGVGPKPFAKEGEPGYEVHVAKKDDKGVATPKAKVESDDEVVTREDKQVFKKVVDKKVGKILQTSPKSFQVMAMDMANPKGYLLNKEFPSLEKAKEELLKVLGESIELSESWWVIETNAFDKEGIVKGSFGSKEQAESYAEHINKTIKNKSESAKVFSQEQFNKMQKKGQLVAGLENESNLEEAKKEKWAIQDWAGNWAFEKGGYQGSGHLHGPVNTFDSWDDAEDFLSEKLGDKYEDDRGEYEIVKLGKDGKSVMDEAVKVQKLKRMSASDRSKARMEYRKKRTKIKRAVKKLHKKSSWKKKHKKFVKAKHGRKAGARKRFIMAGIDSMATIAEGLNRGLNGLEEQTLNQEQLLLVFESIDGICNKINQKVSNLFEESPEEKKLGYDMNYVGQEWDELDDHEEEGDEVEDEMDLDHVGQEWDEIDDHEKEGDEVEDEDYEDENEKDYVGAQESVMIDMRCMAEDAKVIREKLASGEISEENAKEVFVSMVNHIVESTKVLTQAMEEEFNYVGQDNPDEVTQKPEAPESNAGKYIDTKGEPDEETDKPVSPESNAGQYVGKGGKPGAETQKPVAPESNTGKYVDTKGEPKEVNKAPVSPESNAGKYVGKGGEPEAETDKPVKPLGGSKYVGESEEISLGKGNRAIPADSNMGKWMIDQFEKLGVSEDEKEDVANVLSSIWNQSKTIYVRGKAKKYSKQLMDLDQKEGSKGNASFVEAKEDDYRRAYKSYKYGNYHSEKEEDAAWDELEATRLRLGLSKEDADDIRIDVDETASERRFEAAENKYVGKDKPSETNKAPVKPESNKGKHIGTKGEPGEEDETLDVDSMKGKHVGEKQGKLPKEVPVLEDKNNLILKHLIKYLVNKGKDVDGVAALLAKQITKEGSDFLSIFDSLRAKKNNLMDLANKIIEYSKEDIKEDNLSKESEEGKTFEAIVDLENGKHLYFRHAQKNSGTKEQLLKRAKEEAKGLKGRILFYDMEGNEAGSQEFESSSIGESKKSSIDMINEEVAKIMGKK